MVGAAFQTGAEMGLQVLSESSVYCHDQGHDIIQYAPNHYINKERMQCHHGKISVHVFLCLQFY